MLGKNLLRIEEHKPPTFRELSDEELARVSGGMGDWFSNDSISHFLTLLLSAFTPFLIGFTNIRQKKKASTKVKPETSSLPIHYPYPHRSVPEHAKQVVAEGKFQEAKAGKTGGIVFDSSQAGLLFDALSNPDHKYRQRAVQLVRRFNKAVEKDKAQTHIPERGIVMEQASQKYGISATILRDWEEMGLIPVLYKGKGKQGVYLDEAAVARATTLYQEAKQKGIQPTRFLKAELAQQAERRPQLDQGITANSAAREFNVPTNFLLRWAKELGVIPILSEGTGAGSATYLDREKAREVAELYHEAKRQKIQPKKLLERMSAG
jgi:DNA-binding transcriptional MerR regulator